MNLLYVYENRNKLNKGFEFLCDQVKPHYTVNYGSKIISSKDTNWYFFSINQLDHIRGLQYHNWYQMGNWSRDLETWEKDFLEGHKRYEKF